MNHESYVSLETAKLLKEAGFDWEVGHYLTWYGNDPNGAHWSLIRSDEYIDWNHHHFKHAHSEVFSAPTLEVAQKWLREVKGLHICVKADAASIDCKYFVTVIISDTKWGNVQDENMKTILFNTYEEAQEAGIKKALEIILEKGE